jgi:hypothetical protein
VIALLRRLAFVASAIGVEMGRGVGLAALAVALLLGFLRGSLLWLAAVAALSVVASIVLFEPGGTGGKVEHGLSNVVFVAFVYVVIVLAGYLVGRIMRALRS